ncbi:MAG: hypothetical protein SFU55_11370 [Methylophilus sp.]|nr:hypothetical protein [Methylophilus sp.]
MKSLKVLFLILMSLPSVADESLGRLFSTPMERATLDRVRQTKKEIVPQKIEAPNPSIEQAPLALPDAVAVQGYVKRTDGKKSTIWINHEALQEGDSNHDVVVGKLPTNANRVPVKIKANGKQFALKAGQVYDPETNKVKEMRASAQGDSVSGESMSGTIGD